MKDTSTDDRRDPLEEERVRAREKAEGTQLPSEGGLGPGAGETPIADVTTEGGWRRGGPPQPGEAAPALRISGRYGLAPSGPCGAPSPAPTLATDRHD
jgi:hypothetical protein